MRSVGKVPWLAVVLVLAGACGASPDVTGTDAANQLVWDVSGGHTLDDVDWPNDLTAFHLDRGVDVDLTLPGGREVNERVAGVTGHRIGAVISELDLRYPVMTTDDAYDLARSLGEEWDIDLQNIDAWYERRRAQRAQGEEDFSDVAFTGTPHSDLLAPGGPSPAIEIFNSFDADRPAIVALTFYWPRSTGS